MIQELKQALEAKMIDIIDTRRRFVAQIVTGDPEYDPQAHAAFLLQHHITVEDVEHDMVLCKQIHNGMDAEQSIPEHEAEIEEAAKELERLEVSNAEIELAMVKTKDEAERDKLRKQLEGNKWMSEKATSSLDTARTFLASARDESQRLARFKDPLSSNPTPGNYLLTPRPKRYGADGLEVPAFGTGLCMNLLGKSHTAGGLRYRG